MVSDLERILPLQSRGTRPPLFCVHAVSGSAYSYTGLARQLGSDQPVYGVEAPGFDNHRSPVRSLSALADEYTATLHELQPSGGYRLLGWSLGGLVAFEMAKRLAAAGTPAQALVMVDSGLPVPLALPPERDVLRRFIRDMMGLSDETPPDVEDVFARLPADVNAEVAFEAVAKSQILPEELDVEVLAEQYGVFHALLEGYYSIHVTGPYTGRAVHVMAERSPAEEMRWTRVIPALREFVIPGSTHHTLWTGAHLLAVTEIVKRELDGADNASAENLKHAIACG